VEGLGSIAPEIFRRCVGEFATGVCVVCAEWEGTPAGMTLNSFTSVSLDPLLVLVSLGHGSRTLGAVRHSRRFSVSVLGRDQRDAAIVFASRSDPFPSAYTGRDHAGSLIVRGAVATMGCAVTEVARAGDHDLVLGSVESITHGGGEPLIFHRGRFGGLVTDATVPPGHPIGLDEGAGW
jgi:3-hydroxy-9,10-secoandrosta-1,3,5(10)-triene-9,17-dione monooxygenase reductase component